MRFDDNGHGPVRADVVDRSKSLALGQAEKRPLHNLPLIAQLDIRQRGHEKIELRNGKGAPRHDPPYPAPPAAPVGWMQFWLEVLQVETAGHALAIMRPALSSRV